MQVLWCMVMNAQQLRSVNRFITHDSLCGYELQTAAPSNYKMDSIFES
jgi:hypothetical protein